MDWLFVGIDRGPIEGGGAVPGSDAPEGKHRRIIIIPSVVTSGSDTPGTPGASPFKPRLAGRDCLYEGIKQRPYNARGT